jgi:3-oxoacyl-[acyl-carrier-protein] synthase II
MKQKRVVITGIGAVTPIGIGKEEFWRNCLLGKSGIKKIKYFDVSEYTTKIAATVEDFEPDKFMDKITVRRSDNFARFAIAATKMAIDDSKIENAYDSKSTGIFIGCGLGGMFFYEKQILEVMNKGPKSCNPISVPKIIPNSVNNQIAILFKIKGPNITITTACSSGAHAIGQAYDAIRLGRADVFIAGGTEAAIVQYNYLGFDVMGVMSKKRRRYGTRF